MKYFSLKWIPTHRLETLPFVSLRRSMPGHAPAIPYAIQPGDDIIIFWFEESSFFHPNLENKNKNEHLSPVSMKPCGQAGKPGSPVDYRKLSVPTHRWETPGLPQPPPCNIKPGDDVIIIYSEQNLKIFQEPMTKSQKPNFVNHQSWTLGLKIELMNQGPNPKNQF